MEQVSLDELRAVKREMVEVGKVARKVMHPLEVAGMLIWTFSDRWGIRL